MATLPIRALHLPHLGLSAGFARVISVIATVIDVFADAQRQARAAHKRYPFIEG